MIKKRVLTGLVLAALSILLMFEASRTFFMFATAVVASICAFEWSTFAGIGQLWKKLFYIVLFWLGLYGAHCFLGVNLIYYGSWVWLLLLVLMLISQSWVTWVRHQITMGVLGLYLLILMWQSAVMLHNFNPFLLFHVGAVVCCADIFAYVFGSIWGKHLLAPKISPKKTIEGVLAAVIGGTIVSALVVLDMRWLSWHHYMLMVLIGSLSVIVAALGDLFESLIKRAYHLKDSGNLLPGHGGMLDRLDSLLVAIPIYALLCMLLSLPR